MGSKISKRLGTVDLALILVASVSVDFVENQLPNLFLLMAQNTKNNKVKSKGKPLRSSNKALLMQCNCLVREVEVRKYI